MGVRGLTSLLVGRKESAGWLQPLHHLPPPLVGSGDGLPTVVLVDAPSLMHWLLPVDAPGRDAGQLLGGEYAALDADVRCFVTKIRATVAAVPLGLVPALCSALWRMPPPLTTPGSERKAEAGHTAPAGRGEHRQHRAPAGNLPPATRGLGVRSSFAAPGAPWHTSLAGRQRH